MDEGKNGRAIAPRIIKKGNNFLFQKNTNTSIENANATQADLEPVLNKTRMTGKDKIAHAAFLRKDFSLKIIDIKKGIVRTKNSP